MSHFTGFNCHGNTRAVRAFWAQKLGRIAAMPGSHYVETSHLLMKAGLAENIDLLTAAGTVHFVVLERDLAATVRSYRRRGDFTNRVNMRACGASTPTTRAISSRPSRPWPGTRTASACGTSARS